MKYQALEEGLDQSRISSKAEAMTAMRQCVEAWAGLEVVNAIVGAFYELGLDPEKMDISQDQDKFIVYSDDIYDLGEEEREQLADVIGELFEKRMSNLYGIYIAVKFPRVSANLMRVELGCPDRPQTIMDVFQTKASRI